MLVLDFCNIREWSIEVLRDLQKKYRLAETVPGIERGYEYYIFTKQERNRAFFDGKGGDFGFDALPVTIPLDNPRFADLWVAFQESQQEYRAFLDKMLAGHLDVGYLNDLVKKQRFVGIPIEFGPSEDIFKPSVDIKRFGEGYFEDHVEWDIVTEFIFSPDNRFKRLRKCAHCEKYFLFTKNPEQKYCSDTCRKRSWNKGHPEYLRGYMKKARTASVYVKAANRRD